MTLLPRLGLLVFALALPAATRADRQNLSPSVPYPDAADSLETAIQGPPGLLPLPNPPPSTLTGVAPTFTTQPVSQSVAPGAAVTLTGTVSGTPAPVYQWLKNGRFIRGANAASYTIAAAAVGDAGTYVLEAYNGAGFASSRPATISVAPAGLVTAGPQSQSIATGATATFNVAATGTGLTYQWQFNGKPIAGATAATYTLANAGPGASGSFDVLVSSGSSVVADEFATLKVTTNARLSNLSCRAQVGTGNDVLIAGFAIGGTGTKQVLLRGIGPTLATQFSVTGALATPQLTLFDGREHSLATNSGWGGLLTLSAVFNAVGAFALPANSADAALLETLGSGGYSSLLTGANGSTGIALAEIYDADTGTPTADLVNVSARGYVGAAGSVLIAGFAIAGPSSETVLIRGIGPGLKPYVGFPGTVSGTVVTLYDSNNNPITANAGWGNDPWITGTSSQVGAFPLVPNSLDSALLVTIPPGSYTVQVAGVSGGSGIGLVEVYEVR